MTVTHLGLAILATVAKMSSADPIVRIDRITANAKPSDGESFVDITIIALVIQKITVSTEAIGP